MKQNSLILAIMLTAMSLSACGGSGGSSSVTDTAASTSTTDTTDSSSDSSDNSTDTTDNTDTADNTDNTDNTDNNGFEAAVLGDVIAKPVFVSTPNAANGSKDQNDVKTDVRFGADFQPQVQVRNEDNTAFENLVNFEVEPAAGYAGYNVYEAEGGILLGSTTGQNLSYSSFGVWATGDVANILADGTGSIENSAGFFGYNRQSETPTSGTASYAGDAIALENNAGALAGIYTGTFTADADFAARTVNGAISLTEQRSGDALSIQTGELTINRNSGTFNGSGFTSSAGHNGSGNGAFSGPDQAEITGAFSLNNGDSNIAGAFGGTKQ